MTKYFSRLPVILYNGMFVRNLLTRVQFAKETKANSTIFYPYQLKESDSRLDVISDKYYKNPDYAWLVAMTNEVIDPYYDTGLTSESLDNFIAAKYGSTSEAREQIVYWRNDWASDDSIISVDTFNALTLGEKKYFNATLNFDGQVIGYQRKQEDWIVDTNQLITLNITTSTPFAVNSRVTTNTLSTGTVAYCNNSVMTLKHIQGNFGTPNIVSTNTSTINVSSVVNTSFAIEPQEEQYWAPVSAYDYEAELNQSRRNITLLDNRLTNDVIKEMTDLLS